VLVVAAVSAGGAGFAVEVVVIGCPPPVSVAVVPVVDGCTVSVDPVVLSTGFRLHATQTASRAMAASRFMPRRYSKCETALARLLKGFATEVL